MSFLSGKAARVQYATSSFIAVGKWTATIKVDKHDVTSSESAGYAEFIGGVAQCDFSLEGNYDVGSNPVAAWVPGGNTATVKLYLNGTSGPYVSMPLAFIESFEIGSEVRGKVTVRITGSGTSTFTAPAS
jgi:hypothetical protein